MLWRNSAILYRIANLDWQVVSDSYSPPETRFWRSWHIAVAVRIVALATLALGAMTPATAAEKPFDEWLVELRAEARSRGISDATLDSALNGAEPIARVIELDRNQPEFTLTFAEYLAAQELGIQPAVAAGETQLTIWFLVTCWIAYMILQFIDGNLLQPLLFSEVVELHPIAIFVAILVFGGLFGVWGLFFAIPAATLVRAILVSWPGQEDETLTP